MGSELVYALGQDEHWLSAVARIASEQIRVRAILCQEGFPACLSRLPAVDPEAFILLDATGQRDVTGTVQRMYDAGWRRVAIVAADPTWRTARDIFLIAPEYDYWKKTYVPEIIRSSLCEYSYRSRGMGAGGLPTA